MNFLKPFSDPRSQFFQSIPRVNILSEISPLNVICTIRHTSNRHRTYLYCISIQRLPMNFSSKDFSFVYRLIFFFVLLFELFTLDKSTKLTSKCKRLLLLSRKTINHFSVNKSSVTPFTPVIRDSWET